MYKITIYCDGSSIGNPGPGGWGAVVSHNDTVKEFGGYAPGTTNNRMELTAAIEALASIRGSGTAIIHTDSSYVINGITKWVKGWIKNGWLTKEKKDVLNKDLWRPGGPLRSLHSITVNPGKSSYGYQPIYRAVSHWRVHAGLLRIANDIFRDSAPSPVEAG